MSPSTEVTRSRFRLACVIADSSGASALLAAPRAPAAQDCSLSIASSSITAQRVRKSPVDRDWLLRPYMLLVRLDGPPRDSVARWPTPSAPPPIPATPSAPPSSQRAG